MKPHAVTVVIPNYNGARFLGETIESVLSQTWTALEVAVIDNASTDESEAMCRSFSDPRLHFVRHDKHVGGTQNWNRAIAYPSAEMTAMLHSDDLWDPEFLAVTIDALRRHPAADAAICNARVIDSNGETIDRTTLRLRQRHEDGVLGERAYERLLAGMDIYPCSWLVRRELLREYPFDERYRRAPDWDFWLRVMSRPDRVVAVPRQLCSYRLHGSSDTFTEATIQELRHDEVRIVEEALRRRKVSAKAERRARAMIDVRNSIRILQIAGQRRVGLAMRMTAALVRTRGLVGLARAIVGLAALPEARATVASVVRSGRR